MNGVHNGVMNNTPALGDTVTYRPFGTGDPFTGTVVMLYGDRTRYVTLESIDNPNVSHSVDVARLTLWRTDIAITDSERTAGLEATERFTVKAPTTYGLSIVVRHNGQTTVERSSHAEPHMALSAIREFAMARRFSTLTVVDENGADIRKGNELCTQRIVAIYEAHAPVVGTAVITKVVAR